MLVAVKQYLGGKKFKGDLEVERIVTQWLMTQDTDRHQKGEVKGGLYRK
jgi:hypothetical protein